MHKRGWKDAIKDLPEIKGQKSLPSASQPVTAVLEIFH